MDNNVGRRMLKLGLSISFSLMIGLFRSPFPADGAAAEVLQIYASNYPIAYMAQRIAGESGEVHFPVPPGIDPAFWNPSLEVIGRFQEADLVLINGAGYEGWLGTVSLPRSRLIDTSRSFAESYIPLQAELTHSHGPKGEHSHEGVAFTTWLDLQLAGKQAESIAAVLSRRRPADKKMFQQNLADLLADLDRLDAQLLELGKRLGGEGIIGSHPVYQYLASRYGLHVRSLHWEPDQVPDAGQQEELADLLAKKPARMMLWEDQPLAETLEIVKNYKIIPVVFQPCGNRPKSGDFLSVIQENIDSLAAALQV